MDDSFYDGPEIESDRESDDEIGEEIEFDRESGDEIGDGELWSSEEDEPDGPGVMSIPNSKKKFKSLHLKNGLTALIVSNRNSGCLRAAAAVTVGVGSFSDPQEAQGLAHFIEHMISRGSERFPKENDFENYISMHGGSKNAETSDEHTIYYWEVDGLRLEGALERFSQFFISPLFDPDIIDQQICIMESEFELAKQDDAFRLVQLQHHTSKNDHLFNRFTNGNKDSLCAEGIDALRKRAKKFFDDHYYGASLNLCVIGTESLSELENLVEKYFGNVRESPKTIFAKSKPKPMWDASTLYVLDGVGGKDILNLVWMVSPSSEDFEKPEIYLINLLSNQGKDSLYAFLKDKGWVFDITADMEDAWKQYKTEYRLFTLRLSLTNLGLQKKYDLITYIYKYIKSLRNMKPQKWFWEDYWKAKEIEYACLDIADDAKSPLDFAQYLSGNMQKYQITDVLSGDYEQDKWNVESIIDFLKELTPKNMRIDVISNSFQAEGSKTEPWYQMHYKEEKIPPEFIKEWSSDISESDQSEFPLFPLRNPFIPTSFIPRSIKIENTYEPQRIVNKPFIKMWYKSEEGPSHVFLGINLNMSYDLKEDLMMDLLLLLLKDELSEIIFQGREANLCTSLCRRENKLVFEVEGYRENIKFFISELWKIFICYSPSFQRFKIMKQEMAKDFRNMGIEEEKADLLMESMLYKEWSGLGKKLNALKQVSFANLKEFVGVMCSQSQISIEGFCCGDFLKDEVREISKIFESTSELSGAKLRRRRISVWRVPQCGKLSIYHLSKLRRDAIVNNKTDTNSIAKVYFLIGRYKDIKRKGHALLALFNSIVNEKAFHELRSQEKLGYIADCHTDNKRGVCGFYIHVISSTYNPNHLLKRIYSFINDMKQLLEGIEEESFENYKETTISQLGGSKFFIWDEIVCNRYNFDRHMDDEVVLYRTTKEDLIEWYDKYIRFPRCRKLAVCIWGCKTNRKKNSERYMNIFKQLLLSSTRLGKVFKKKKKKLVSKRKATS